MASGSCRLHHSDAGSSDTIALYLKLLIFVLHDVTSSLFFTSSLYQMKSFRFHENQHLSAASATRNSSFKESAAIIQSNSIFYHKKYPTYVVHVFE